MDHNDLLANPSEEMSTNDSAVSTAQASPGMAKRGWQLLLIGVVLVVLGVLAYPLFQQTPSDPLAQPGAVPPALAGPEATAQANPTSAEAQFQLGNAYVKNGQWAQAVTAYKKAIELNPNYQTAYANLGVVYYQQGQFDLAASQYKKALELNPNDVDVSYNLGALYLQQAVSTAGQPDQTLLTQAVEQLENVNRIAPELAEPYFSLGVAYTFLNRRSEAANAFQAFLDRDSGADPRAGQEARRYLQDLQGQ
jgi:tetratricopeptide (TPR) repeat protein